LRRQLKNGGAFWWQRVLVAARSGDGSLDLLHNRALLSKRLHGAEVSVSLRAIDQLAAMNDPKAWEEISTVLNDPKLRVHASERIAWGRYFPLFDAVWEAEKPARSPDVEIDPTRYIDTFLDL
jgi:hypothetical protein